MSHAMQVDSSTPAASTSTLVPPTQGVTKDGKGQEGVDGMTSKDYYADSYAHFGIHEEMLKDTVRTLSYKNAILQNPHLFKDKVVLDVGCGTGILSMFAAKAGAKLVIGIDMSNILDQAQKIVEKNGFKDKIVLIKGKLEEVELPVKQVDIIVSEWMGYALLYESMLDTVIAARDKYLAPGGLLFPDSCTIQLAAIEDEEYRQSKLGFWNDVYGFDYSSMLPVVMKEPLVDCVEMQAVVSTPCAIYTIDLNTVTLDELKFKVPFELRAERTDYVHAFLAWFDVAFNACHKPIKFSTGPHAQYTHWKQTVFYIKDALTINKNERITGQFSCAPNPRNHRDLDIVIDYEVEGQHSVKETMEYQMS